MFSGSLQLALRRRGTARHSLSQLPQTGDKPVSITITRNPPLRITTDPGRFRSYQTPSGIGITSASGPELPVPGLSNGPITEVVAARMCVVRI